MRKAITILATIALLTSVVGYSSVSAKTEVDLTNPDAVVVGFFKSMKTGDADSMAVYSKNTSYDSDSEEQSVYEKDYTRNKLKEYKVLTSRKIDESASEFLVQLDYEKGSEIPPIPYRVIKENGEWQIIITPIDINLKKGSPDHGKVSVNTNKNDTHQDVLLESSVSPDGTDMLRWSFTDLRPGVQITSASSWEQSRTDGIATINGYQQGASCCATILYEAIEKLNDATVAIHDDEQVNGDYPSWGSWFNRNLFYLPNSTDLFVRFTNKGNMFNVKGAGNVYN